MFQGGESALQVPCVGFNSLGVHHLLLFLILSLIGCTTIQPVQNQVDLTFYESVKIVIDNQMEYKADKVNTLTCDFNTIKGDCEDFACVTGKHLIRLGVNKNRLKPVLLYSLNKNQWHMILLVDNKIVFDNLSNHVYLVNELGSHGYVIPTFERARQVQLNYEEMFKKEYIGT